MHKAWLEYLIFQMWDDKLRPECGKKSCAIWDFIQGCEEQIHRYSNVVVQKEKASL